MTDDELLSLSPIDRVVTGCSVCPFLGISSDDGQSQPFCAEASNETDSCLDLTIDTILDPPPDWCPLRVAPVLVRLEVKS